MAHRYSVELLANRVVHHSVRHPPAGQTNNDGFGFCSLTRVCLFHHVVPYAQGAIAMGASRAHLRDTARCGPLPPPPPVPPSHTAASSAACCPHPTGGRPQEHASGVRRRVHFPQPGEVPPLQGAAQHGTAPGRAELPVHGCAPRAPFIAVCVAVRGGGVANPILHFAGSRVRTAALPYPVNAITPRPTQPAFLFS